MWRLGFHREGHAGVALLVAKSFDAFVTFDDTNERGSIENINGLIRQYLPKGPDFDVLPEWTAEALEETLNFRHGRFLASAHHTTSSTVNQ